MTYNPDKPNEHSQDDPYAVASEATLTPRTYYGQISVNAWFCGLVKGVGKEPYDPQVHKRRSTAIDMAVIPLAQMGVNNELKREMLDWERAWAGITWKSLKDLGVTSLRDLDGKFAAFQWTGTGRKYRNQAGEERESTTFKFIALYDSMAECEAAYYEDTGKQPAETDADGTEPIEGVGGNGNGSNGNSGAHDTAAQFVKAFAKQCRYDIEATKKKCAGQPIITQHIDLDGPEFAELVTAAIGEAA